MPLIFDQHESAIHRGIKTVGIGKRGSQPLSPELIAELMTDFKAEKVPQIAQGAFFAALILKGLTEEEKRFDQIFQKEGTLFDFDQLVEFIAPAAPKFIQNICSKILTGETFDQPTACKIGDFLLSNEPGDGARGLIASGLRVRYETAEEYAGLLEAMEKTFEPQFLTEVPAGEPIIQLAEPFDGMDHSYMITPLVAAHLQRQGYRVLSLMGRNSGPKAGINLWDIAQALKVNFLKSNHDFQQNKPALGWFLDQQDLSKPMDRWVDLRHEILKRPFFATLEKFVNPAKAKILISSAFHPTYTEKMMAIAERAGFPGAVVIRNGIEGSMAFALKRPVKIMCSARQNNGSYQRHEFEWLAEEHLNVDIPVEERVENPCATANAQLIQTFLNQGRTENSLFNNRVQKTCQGIQKAVHWIEENKN